MDVAHAMIAIEPILERVKSGNEATLKELAAEFDLSLIHISEPTRPY